MAFDNNQSESSLPTGVGGKRTSLDLIPKYFRTGVNQKFLNATVDQMISEGEVDKINAFIGRKTTPAHKTTDRYLEDVSTERQAYQLEPALVSYDNLNNVTLFKDYYDYINQLNSFSGLTSDHSVTNSEEYYAWNPHIDWDKFVNYREYYWLPSGPQAITILGKAKGIVSEYSVSLRNDVDNVTYIFAPKDTGDGLLANPTLKLYRGQTYRFNLNCKGRPTALKTVRETGDSYLFTTNVKLYDKNGTLIVDGNNQPITNQFIEEGVIEVTFDANTPNILYYVSNNDINTSGFFTIYDIEENTEIDVESEIVGLKYYTTQDGLNLANGMKVKFEGVVTPEKYATGNWYVEGVGKQIYLVAERELETPAVYTYNSEIEFDNENFDSQGFDINNNYPKDKDYIVINRASKDKNPWSRHNRWFHRSVIETAAAANKEPIVLDQTARAKRPIIEFEPNLQLWNFGLVSKGSVTVVDDFTTDVFSSIEGSLGYNVDGVSLVEGMRVLFTADTDIRVKGRIFKVATFTHLGIKRLTLLEELDTQPQEGETVLVTEGLVNKGKMLYFSNGVWAEGQEKTALNQCPLFNVYDSNARSYGDLSVYPGSTFRGTKLFSYKPGTTIDSELGFGISYRNVGNFGDIVFEFNLHTDTFEYQEGVNLKTEKINAGYLSEINSLSSTSHVNGWVIAATLSQQPVIKQVDIDGTRVNFFPIDMYDNSGDLTDLQVKVYVNGTRQFDTEYTIYREDSIAYVQFYSNLNVGDNLIIKAVSSAIKNDNGYYEFPFNLENNPDNLSLDTFTLGEVNNHVLSIADNIPNFKDTIPGRSSLKDLGNITPFGTTVVQHSAPLMPVAYHITNKKFNIVKALRFARHEYSKFKRNFIRVATESGFDGTVREHFDSIMKTVTKDTSKITPFYLSDMVPVGASFMFQQEVIDNSITDYPLTFDFNLSTPSQRAVLIYLNEEILLHGKDYVFTSDNFVRILTGITEGDDLKIVQYEQTDGCCVPPTPSKFGLYPLYEPSVFVDYTYQTPTKVIQGHDGSITVAFNDYRDDLILELERRIYNNVKVSYDTSLFDVYDFIGGYNRKSNLSSNDLNSVLAGDFLRWTGLVGTDYTKNNFYEQGNARTYNYSKFTAPDGTELPGFWRGIFKFIYDTDRPNTHPWEMLGFSIQPTWWNDVYGPAPYTSDNLIMWADLAQGMIKEPGKNPVKDERFVRPDLLSWLPVDEVGNLRSPLELGIVSDYVSSYTAGEFRFGDHAPVETAWRRSSEYPFALLTALTILRPTKVFATCFDRVRQYRDDTGQLVYKTPSGNLRFNIQNLVIPSTSNSQTRVFSAGLINYVVDHVIAVQSIDAVNEYADQLLRLKVRLSSKLGGFTTKEKFKLILDSRSPLNSGNVFVPEENYSIILNVSSPVVSVNYSGVIVEKQDSGFIIKGYNTNVPLFKYFKVLETSSDPVVNIGGISEGFVEWAQNQYYSKDKIVRIDDAYFRTNTAHTSSTTFELKYFSRLPKLPLAGGRDIILRSRFDDEVSVLHYGAELKTVQDVVDFLLGYGKYLESIGFRFEHYNSSLRTVTDFQSSAKEFAFWTTQNWSAGAVISLSPCAETVQYQRDYVVVDNIYDNFYEYSVLKQDGNMLEPLFTNSLRNGNSYTISPRNTADGVYNISLNLVQKEHVLILDNVTVFNDVIYDQIQGYRQERIKVVGYKTSGWQGDFDVPGFIYDNALVQEWTPWKDFNLGDTVKYKEFYYSAKTNVAGSEEFDHTYWVKLSGRPEARLIPNWDYRANQFADFYDLDTHSFDVDQQKFAQHLIGYQKRQYLENIINDDVSQYNFYQGMIQEKGTQNSLSKLFDALSTADEDSLEFYEEWAVRLGQYGSNAGFEEVEYLLDETKFLINPQPIELVDRIDPNLVDFVYRILPDQVYIKTADYRHSPLPTKVLTNTYVSTPGYVRLEDVDYAIATKGDISTLDINKLREGNHIWVGYDLTSWDVYRFTSFAGKFKTVEKNGTSLRFTFSQNLTFDQESGDYIGINNTNANDSVAKLIEGMHLVTDIGYNYFEIECPNGFDPANLTTKYLGFFKFISVRAKTVDNINDIGITNRLPSDLVWIDGENNNWAVWKYNTQFNVTTVPSSENYFGLVVSVDQRNTNLAVSSSGKVFYYNRPTQASTWVYKDQLTVLSTQNVVNPNTSLINSNGSFGESVAMSTDSSYLVVGAPRANRPSNNLPNAGYAALYKKDDNDYYVFVKEIFAKNAQGIDWPVEEDYFASFIEFSGNRIIIASKGSVTNVPTLSAYSVTGNLISNGATKARIEFSEYLGYTITSISTSVTNIVVGFSNGNVKVINLTGAVFTEVQTISTPTNMIGSGFASSVAISSDDNCLVVGAPEYSVVSPIAGSIVVYYKVGNSYELTEFIKNPSGREGDRFGAVVKINSAGDQIVVGSTGGLQVDLTTFKDGTTFDLNTTLFKEPEYGVGSVAVFDHYASKFIFSTYLDVGNAIGVNYGTAIAVSDRVYIGDFATAGGAVYEFKSDNKAWYKYREPSTVVDLSKIKSVFLYNTETNQIVSYLDTVDPLQGKILGIAEQELKYKTFYDPSVYSVGTDEVVVDSLMPWKEKQVGQLWWDLSSAKFVNATQGSVLFKANTWANTYLDQSVSVYEWVESEYLPSEWDALADTEEGLTAGISGTSKYGDSAYSVNRTYDTVSKTFKNTYYFWVKNKNVVPDVEFRKISARDVARYISNPKDMGVSYITLLDGNQFALVNCKNLIAGNKIAINIRYWVIDNVEEANIHSHYQLISASDISKPLNKYIEQKWFDSLAGFDTLGNEVPDSKLPAKLKYGVLSRPRQSMFVNRVEALKQFIERVNRALIKKSLIDDIDISPLNSMDEPPSYGSGAYDVAISSYSEIRFVGTNEFEQAQMTPVVENGKITRVIITNSGKGYLNAPSVVINGIGSGAKVKTVIGTEGQLISAIVEQPGSGYASSTSLYVRPLTVLVTTDETANSKWILYTWDATTKSWFRQQSQTYDVTRYWKYVDWYADGYNEFTKVSMTVDFVYQLPYAQISLGDVVKVKNLGVGGWVLLEKINDEAILDTTVNFKTVGRQNGTIQFTENLYKFAKSGVGYDGPTFDAYLYDDQPKEEIQIILKCIRDNILVEDLSTEYKKLFFASLRYAFSEQQNIDWAFKTSFVRAKHNLGGLEQKPTYQNDNLESYIEYINEVKPYRSKVREFVSSYTGYDVTGSQVTDFDLPVRYNSLTGALDTFKTSVKDGVIKYDSKEILNYPYSDWLYNVGYKLLSIEIVDSGEGYLSAPGVEIIGAPSNITATAYISSGKITKIVVSDPDEVLFITTPVIVLNGGVRDGGRVGKAVAIIGDGKVRSTKIGIKFDRVAPRYTFASLTATETFIASGSQTRFELLWPIDIIKTKTTVTDNNGEVLGTDYTVYNELDTKSPYKRYKGVLVFNTAPENLSTIVIQYYKDVSLFDAADRIQYYYTNPQPGQLGQDLGQLMQGVDYGGVEVTGVDFNVGTGWDALPWFTSGYDVFDPDFTDMIINSDGTTKSFMLNYVPTDIEVINIYLNGVRLDDPNYDIVHPLQVELTAQQGQLVVLQSELTSLQVIYRENDILVTQLTSEIDAGDEFDGLIKVKQLEIDAKQIQIDNAIAVGATPREIADLEDEKAALISQLNTLNDQLLVAIATRDSAATEIPLKQDEVDAKQAQVNVTQATLNSNPPLENPNAIMNSYIGNGIDNGPIVLPNDLLVKQGDMIILRKSTSDGSQKPSDIVYDTQIYGGDFTYATATGIRAEDINIDGDGFVTPTTSHAPEEVITGQVVDTVDIKVYHKIADGAPIIETQQFYKTTTNTFELGQRPASSTSILVKVAGDLVIQGPDYEIDFESNTVTLLGDISEGTEVVITTLSQNGLNILDLDYFTGDGIATEFITVARWTGDYTVFVTVNGEQTSVTTFITDASYTPSGNIGIRFDTAPSLGAIINYTVLGSAVDSISKVNKQTIVYQSGISSYPLSTVPEFIKPLHNSVIVIANGSVLRPSDTVYFTVSGNSRTYSVDPSRYAYNTIDSRQVTVAVNGEQKVQAVDYQWFPANNQLKIKKGVANVGDKISLSINTNAQYSILDRNLELLTSFEDGTTVRVVTFSNHDILDIERTSNTFKSASILTIGSPEYYRFNQIIGRRFKLNRPAIGAEYVWISLNGKLLTPEVDYVLEQNLNYIRFKDTLVFSNGSNIEDPLNPGSYLPADVIDVIAFSNKVTRSSFGYRIFKDMLNKNTYYRLDDAVSTILVEPLNFYDSAIVVEDASGLAEPNARLNKAGVVFVDGERIEYLVKDGNVLRQLKRGTLGTGVKSVYPVDTLVRDQSISQVVPYSDEFVTEKVASGGFTTASSIYPNSSNVTVTSIVIPTDDGTPSPTGGDIVTVVGTGFQSNVTVFVGETECVATRISSTELTFESPNLPVGQYDLVIFNAAIESGPSVQAQSSRVVAGAIKYLKVPLNFAPVVYENSSWYRVSIPAEYNQANDIEVFVGGKRLHKNSYTVWDPALGPDSPIGDVKYEAEFSVNGGNYVRLTKVPPANVSVIVQKRVGRAWAPQNVSLVDSQTDQAKFIKSTYALLPEKTK